MDRVKDNILQLPFPANEGSCEEELPKLTVGQLSADRLPTGYRQAIDRLATVF